MCLYTSALARFLGWPRKDNLLFNTLALIWLLLPASFSLNDHKYTLSTPVSVSGDFLVVSLSEGHQYEPLSVPGSDMVFIVNWEQEKLVSSQKFLHSPVFDAAKMRMREENCSDGMYPGDDDDYSLNSSYYDDDMVNSSLGVSLTEKDSYLFLLHNEVVLPEME